MASKKASASSPVSSRIAPASAGEVSGPVAMITLSHSAGGRPATSARSMVTSGCVSERRRDRGGEAFAVDRQRAAGRNLMRVGRPHDQRAGAAQLLVEQADGIGLGVVGAERVGADQFGEPVGLVRLGAADGAHLVEDDGNAAPGDLPGGLGAGEAAADDVDWSHGPATLVGLGRGFNRRVQDA